MVHEEKTDKIKKQEDRTVDKKMDVKEIMQELVGVARLVGPNCFRKTLVLVRTNAKSLRRHDVLRNLEQNYPRKIARFMWHVYP